MSNPKRQRLSVPETEQTWNLAMDNLYRLQLQWNKHFNLFPRDATQLYDYVLSHCKGDSKGLSAAAIQMEKYMNENDSIEK